MPARAHACVLRSRFFFRCAVMIGPGGMFLGSRNDLEFCVGGVCVDWRNGGLMMFA